MSAQDVERGLAAPEILGLETRVEIRHAAAQLLEGMPEGSGRLSSTSCIPGKSIPRASVRSC